jgi:hypothetical protein
LICISDTCRDSRGQNNSKQVLQHKSLQLDLKFNNIKRHFLNRQTRCRTHAQRHSCPHCVPRIARIHGSSLPSQSKARRVHCSVNG